MRGAHRAQRAVVSPRGCIPAGRCDQVQRALVLATPARDDEAAVLRRDVAGRLGKRFRLGHQRLGGRPLARVHVHSRAEYGHERQDAEQAGVARVLESALGELFPGSAS